VQNSIKYSKAWPKFKRFTLINNLRSDDPNFSDWLLQLGDGTLTNQEGLNPDIILIPNEFLTNGNLVTEIYGDDINEQDFRDLANRAILTPLNKTVDKVNEEIIAKLDGELMIYYSTDEAHCDDPKDAANFPLEFMNTLTPSGMPPHALKLKLNSIVILLRNLDTKRGLCNGTRLLITKLKRNVIFAEILTGSGKGNEELIPRIILDSTRSSDIPFQLRRRQFPVKPAFAMTINKAQGQTLDKVGILLPEPIFGHGQLYVAFSRAKKACNVRVKILDTPFQGKLIKGSDKVFTRNIVYREVL
jgi:ATP-dependent DNA helicase PIF1